MRLRRIKNSLASPYRPHNPGHDYYEPGIYLVTLVVADRRPLLGTLGSDPLHPEVVLSPLGEAVQQEWEKTAAIQRTKGRALTLLAQAVMPDHWHGVLAVEQRMDCHLGVIIQAVKSAITARWWQLSNMRLSPSSAEQIRKMSAAQREYFYSSLPEEARPLFDANYDDTICLDERHREAMVHYVEDNPRRAIIRHLRPDFMQRRLHISIGGCDYAAFGNLFLLRWARKEQVF